MKLKLLLKRGALVAAANWQTIAIQFVAETTFQVLLAVPIVGAAILVTVLLGSDPTDLLRGGLREIFTAIAGTLTAEPIALVAFIGSFGIVLVGGSVLMFLVKGGTVDILASAEADAGPLEHEPLTYDGVMSRAARFSLTRFVAGCRRLFRRYLVLGLALIVVYGLSGGAYLAFVLYGYRNVGDRILAIRWTAIAALSAALLVAWITIVNWFYLLVQIAIAAEDVGPAAACVAVARFIRTEFRELAGVFGVTLVLVVAGTLASTLASPALGLIAFVPLVGLAVIPLQILAFVMRGLVFQYLGLAALTAYVALYHRHLARRADAAVVEQLRPATGSA